MGMHVSQEERDKETNEYLKPHTKEELADLEDAFNKAGHEKVANAVMWYRTIGFKFAPYFDPIEQAIRGPFNKLPTLMHLDDLNRIVAKWRFALGK
jgi:hypothetical protein